MDDPVCGRKPIRSWQDLEVWKAAHELVLMVYEVCRGFPRDERFRLGDQLRRAAVSVPTNIAEGKGRSSRKEYLQFLAVSRGSVEEVKYLVLLSKDLKYISPEAYASLSREYDKVGRMLNGLMRSLRLRGPSARSAPSTQPPTPCFPT
jgi:four helix bundle protein